ncbi:hypothetical protein A1O7_03603 [Cladophialophora yegresii CBS 114405]|uniref:Uncharacterized protein n=1 Tax=Cladophialophora yegresii CBS 114405 TaxID=1182544 RepID=W9W5C2_9EURO|nr:uncharacterized protein A1O7_03603 [Cladophialophora yegresii CBS 114405]EXJ63158.1 hypothetical protein A1O7_03603 [Cladophialophora yegresii CBS 114405]
MQSQRQRVYSFSSNETILEVDSSSPPSSTEPVCNHTTPTWESSTGDQLAPSCYGTRFCYSHGLQTRHHNTAQSSATLNGEPGNLDLMEVEGEEEYESEESIDWDEDSEEEEERQQRLAYWKQPTAHSTFPQTIGFWFDSWLAEVGARAVNLDLQALCGSIQLWRARTDIPRRPTLRGPGQEYQQYELGSPFPSTTDSVDVVDKEDDSLASQTGWDTLLREMRIMARVMHQCRKRRDEWRNVISDSCEQWVAQLSEQRGAFVEELEVGYEIERQVDGTKWNLKLGYRRNDAVAEDMDSEWDEDSEGVAVAPEENGMDDEVGGEQVVDDQGCRTAFGNGIGAGVEMTHMLNP